MPSLIKQGEAKVVTKNGEVFVNIALELTIKLEGASGGSPSFAVDAAAPKAEQAEKVKWEIPDFSPSKIDFGKRG